MTMLWVTILPATMIGAILGGWRSLQLARRGELQQAQLSLHRAAMLTGTSGAALTFPTLGWPFITVTRSVPEEVTHKVFFFWTTTKTVIHNETGHEFSFLLLVPMVLVGALCYYLEIWLVRLAWRYFG
jgi:hypothetical protein